MLFSSHQLDLVEDVCQDVVIVDHGRVVLAGELETSARRPRNESSTSGIAERRRSGPVCARYRSSRTRRVRSGSRCHATPTLAALLTRMTGHGEVTSFTYQPPTLSDLFIEAVRT